MIPLTAIAQWFLTSRTGRGVLVALVVLAALLGFRMKSVRDGIERERAAQTERNRKTKEVADAARIDALAADDPRAELLRRFRRSDGG